MPVLRHLLTGLMLASASVFAQAAPDASDAVSRALYNGDAALALKLADTALAEKPKDAQVRFLKAVSLGELGRAEDAIALYQALSQDYPELAEPYNNLAVLQAARGDIDEARQSLETALRNRPGQATALENLGDVYAQLAARAWSQAAQSDPASPDRSRVNNKLALLRELQQRTR